MARLIKRYGSRKLYDTSESRYVSLEDIAGWIRAEEEIQVLDNATNEDVTVQTLTQVISEEGRKKSAFLPSDLLHELIRTSNDYVGDGVRRIQTGVEGFVKKSIDRIVPVSKVREEMMQLRRRLDELENAVAHAEKEPKDKREPEAVAEAVEEGVDAGEEAHEQGKTRRKRATRKVAE